MRVASRWPFTHAVVIARLVLCLCLVSLIAGCGAYNGKGVAITVSPTSPADPSIAYLKDKYRGATLAVACPGGLWGHDFIRVFRARWEELTGSRLLVVPGATEELGTPWTGSSAGSAFDVVIGDERLYHASVSHALWRPLRLERIPNVRDLFQALTKTEPLTAAFGVPFAGDLLALASTSDVELKAWADLWNPDLRGRVGFNTGFPEGLYAGILALGLDPYTALRDQSQLREVLTACAELAADARWYDSGESLLTLIERGECQAGFAAQQLLTTGPGSLLDLKVVLPEDGLVGSMDYALVTASTGRRAMAEDFINFLISPSMQQSWMEQRWQSPVNARVTLPKKADKQLGATIALTEEQWASWHRPDWALFSLDLQGWIARWREEVLRASLRR